MTGEEKRSLVSGRGCDRATTGFACRVLFIEAAGAMGGVQHSTFNVAQRLERARFEASVVCPTDGDLPIACRQVGVPVYVLPRPALRSTSIKVGKRRRVPNPAAWAWDAGAALQAARLLARFLSEQRPDLVVTKGLLPHLYGGLAARWLEIPCVWHLQDLISERFWGLYSRAFGILARWLPARIVVDGGAIGDQLPARLRPRTSVILNGIDTGVFHPAVDGKGVRQEFRIPAEAFVIGNLARVTPWKGQHHLLEAFAKIVQDRADAWLLLVGSPLFDDDAYERYLRQRAAALGLERRVVFAGYRRDTPQVLAAMDIFAYTSVEKDTSPLALLSAMACGLPVVAFDIPGVREVLGGDDGGILVPVAQMAPLGDAITRVAGDGALASKLCAGARTRAEAAFSLEQHVRAMEAVFLKTVGG